MKWTISLKMRQKTNPNIWHKQAWIQYSWVWFLTRMPPGKNTNPYRWQRDSIFSYNNQQIENLNSLGTGASKSVISRLFFQKKCLNREIIAIHRHNFFVYQWQQNWTSRTHVIGNKIGNHKWSHMFIICKQLTWYLIFKTRFLP